MKREVKLSECVGKTIENMAFESYGPQLLITFTDGTFTAVEAEPDSSDDTTVITEATAQLLCFPAATVIALGIMTPEEMEETLRNRSKAHAESARESDRRLFETLKTRYGW